MGMAVEPLCDGLGSKRVWSRVVEYVDQQCSRSAGLQRVLKGLGG